MGVISSALGHRCLERLDEVHKLLWEQSCALLGGWRSGTDPFGPQRLRHHCVELPFETLGTFANSRVSAPPAPQLSSSPAPVSGFFSPSLILTSSSPGKRVDPQEQIPHSEGQNQLNLQQFEAGLCQDLNIKLSHSLGWSGRPPPAAIWTDVLRLHKGDCPGSD